MLNQANESALPKAKGRRQHKGRFFPPPEWSGRLYVQIDSSMVHMFRYFLEAEDNLGIMTVVDRWRATLLVRFSPHQEKEIRQFLQAMQESIEFKVLDLNFT